MHDLDLILTLTGALSAALACGALTHRLRLSPIAGYLLAGVIFGPYTPGFEADASLARQMAGSKSIPTDTKNSTAKASRIGSASDAARRL